ncbi:MAG: ATP-binding protein, partial [Chloroflexota bacterium]
MPFKVSARVLHQLGAELISSDAIAFYELIKNAFDAHSKRVKISVVSRIPYDALKELKDLLLNEKKQREIPQENFVDEFQKRLLDAITFSYPEETPLSQEILKARSYDALEKALDEANYIVIADTGKGMSYGDLESIYLTVGTPSRWHQKQQSFLDLIDHPNKDADTILGEKGVGRLSVMRLGNKLRVTTSKEGEKRWNILDVDWSLFLDVDKYIEDIDIKPCHGGLKENKSVSGTTLYITSLTSEWSKEKLEDIAKMEFSKLT